MKQIIAIITIILSIGFFLLRLEHSDSNPLAVHGLSHDKNVINPLSNKNKKENNTTFISEDIFKQFHDWMDQALKNDGTVHPALVEEGVKLAKLRKPLMSDLIKNDPKQALEKGVSWKQFLSMPVAVRRQLEEPFSENAEWQVLPICNPASSGPHGNVVSMVLSDGTTATTYAVTPYGRRIGLQTKGDIPLQGIRMDGAAAVDEKIFQVLSSSDLNAVKTVFPVANNNPNLSAVDNAPLPQNPVAALAGKKIYLFASTEELQRAENTIQKAENHPGPRMRPALMPMADLPPGSSAPTLNLPAITQAAIQASQNWTLTPKKILCIVVDFPDKPGAPVDINDLTNMVATLVNTNIINFSYGKTSLQVTAAPQAVYRMPHSVDYYTNNFNDIQLHLDALSLCKNSGLDPSLFDVRMVCFPGIGMKGATSGVFNFVYGGRAQLGGSNQWIQSQTNWDSRTYVDTITHETGHNYGVSHAHSWDTTDGSVMSTNGTNTEYGDIYDTMAKPTYHPADYNPILKSYLGWMNTNQTLNVSNGISTNRIYAFDCLSPQSNAPLALRVQNGSSQAFVVGIRRAVTNNTYLNNGLYVLWDYDATEQTTRLLDMTPNSPAGKNDAALSLYKTFTDPTGLVKITPIAQGGSGSNAWMDVAVALGPLTPQPPAITMSNSIYGKARSMTAFSCTATNSNNAALYYTWDFGDGSVALGGNSISHIFQVEGTYQVTVTVTDAQGGTATSSCTANISDPLQNWLSVANPSGVIPSNGICANGAWILGGNSWSTYLFSADGATWKTVTIPNNWPNGFVCSTAGTYVSSGFGGITYSLDSQTWTKASLNNTNTAYGLAYGNGIFVSGLKDGSILVSSNGSTWSSYTSPAIGTNYLSQIVFGKGVFLSRINYWGTGLCRSSDGVNWNMLSASTGLPTDMQFNQLAYEPNNGIFAVIGWNGSPGWSAVYTSTNGGSNWSSSSVPAGYSVYNLQAGGGIFAALATATNSINPSLLISSDGMNWGAYPITDGATNGLLIGNGQILRFNSSTNAPMQMAAITPLPCNISIAAGGPCRVSSNNTPLTNELPHVGETYPLYIQLNVSGTAQPFDILFSMGAETLTYHITNRLTAANGNGYSWFPFNSNLDGPIPWKITVDSNNTSGNTNISNTISGTFSPIPPSTAVYTYNTNFVTATETNILSFQAGSGTINDLAIVMGSPPDLPTQIILSTNLPSNSQVITTTPQGISTCLISYTNIPAQTFTNIARYTAKLSSLAVNSTLLKQITWSQLTSSIDSSLRPFTQPSTLVQSTDPQISAFVASHLPANYQATLSPYDAARELHKAVAGYITYITPSPGLSALEVLKNKRGDCGTYATLLTACMRNIGIPAKLISGFRLGDQVWHCRMEFYLPTAGWIIADACDSQSIDPTGSYAYYFGNVDNANQFFTIDSGDKKLIPCGNNLIDRPFLQIGDFLWSGGASFINDSSYSSLKIYSSQTLGSFVPIPTQAFSSGATVTITPPVTSSGLPVTVTVKNGPATIAGNTVTLTGAGTVVLAANQPGDSTYLAASEVTTSFDVSKGNQTISFPAVPAQSVTNPSFQLNATASSGLPVSYTTSSTNITVSGNVVSILGAGTATIVASQIGDSNWGATTSITNTFVISKVTNTIGAFTPIPTQTYSNGATVLITSPASSSGLPVTVTVKSGPVTINGNLVSLSGPGTVILAANQVGDANYLPASEVTTSFQVIASQTLGTFPDIPPQTFSNGATVTITPPVASSGLPVSMRILSGPATISGNVVTLTGAGTVVLAADQAGNSNYSAAREVTTSFTVAPGSQTITFSSFISRVFGSGPINLVAASSSGLPVSYASPSTNISVTGNVVTLLGVGTATITASQAGNGNWNASIPVTATLVITPGPQTISAFPSISTQTYTNGATVTISPPVASSGLPVAITVKSGPATISGNTLKLTGPGTVQLAANQAGNGNYLPAAEVRTTFQCYAPQTISAFSIIPQATFSNGATVTITPPMASSGLPVTVTVKSGPATISGNTLALAGAGTVVLAADQGGNGLYGPAPEVTVSFSVNKATNTMGAFGVIPSHVFGDGSFAITPPVASSGLPVTLSVVSGPATITGNTVTITGVGTVVLAADQGGNDAYQSASEVITSFMVAKGSQHITFPALSSQSFGGDDFTLSATASSGLPVSYASPSTNISIFGNLVTILGAGTATITASQGGDGNWNSASPVIRSLLIQQAPQTLSAFSPISPQTYTKGTVLSVTSPVASSGLPVTVTVKSGPATISGNTLTLTGTGTVVLAANQAGNANYSAAPEVTVAFQSSAPQTIGDFAPIPQRSYSNGVTVAITPPVASSGLPVTVTVKSGPATISGKVVTLLGAGTVILAADQSGNAFYLPAAEVTSSFVVGQGSQVITFPAIASPALTTNLLTLPAATASSGLPVTYSVLSGPAQLVGSNQLSLYGTGSVTIQASQPGDANWLCAIPVNQRFAVRQGSQTIHFVPLGSNGFGTAPYLLTNASASSGLPVTYTSSAPKVATIVSNILTVTGLGTATITASQNGNSNWIAAAPVSQTLTVAKGSQSISAFGTIADIPFATNRTVTLPPPLPTSTSGLPVTLSVKSGLVTLKGTTLTITGAGAVMLAADQTGNASYLAAPEITTSFTVQKAPQTIGAFASISAKTNGMGSFGVKLPSASSGLPVALSIQSGPAQISGTNVTLNGAGTVVIAADQAGNGNYLAAPTVQTSFTVAKGNQSITWTAPAKVINAAMTLQLSAVSSSHLPVVYTSSAGNIRVTTNGLVTILGSGTALITASQPGDGNWNPATNVIQSLVVALPSGVVNETSNQITGIAPPSSQPTISRRPSSFPLARPTLSGSVVAWGDNTYGETTLPKGLENVVQLSSRGLHSLALLSNGTVAAWGWNGYGQSTVPSTVTNIVQVAAGTSFSLALKANGTVMAWGDNSLGQTTVPAVLTNTVQISSGSDHALALRSDGTVAAWGWNGYGQTTIPTDATNVMQVATGYFHSVVLKGDGTVEAWGDDSYGETDVPPGLSNVVRIATGLNHTLALRNDGTVAAWGWDNAGQIDVPSGLTGVSQIAAGGNTSFAVTTNGTLVTWGDNSCGQRKPPTGISGIYQFILGLCHALGLKK